MLKRLQCGFVDLREPFWSPTEKFIRADNDKKTDYQYTK
jgi:hypothetical protein